MILFVGAGPGAADLITLRGQKALEAADVVIYAGSLVSKTLLEFCRPDVKIYNSAQLNLDEVLALMLEAARAGQTLVRLHTGDPSLYGAIAEQIRALEKAGIAYDVIPGVSSFAAAAARLGVEYTVPEVSQSLILTRRAGRTPVPEREGISSFAKHQASMVLFLSVFELEALVKELKEGYPPTTPVAVVYKATWPDEKLIQGDLSDIVEKVREAGITRHALVLVGNFLTAKENADFAFSKLYDPTFSTGYRTAVEPSVVNDLPAVKSKVKRLGLFTLTEQGERQAQRVLTVFDEASNWQVNRLDLSAVPQAFQSYEALLFIMATGIVVRKIAPFLKDKTKDPAVLVMDTKGEHLISLISGHLGGANALCQKLALVLNARPVITTATDVHGVFAVDEWARKHGYKIKTPKTIKDVSAALLKAVPVGVITGRNVKLKSLPTGLFFAGTAEEEPQDFAVYLYLGDEAFPERINSRPVCQVTLGTHYLGLGCKKNIPFEHLEREALNFLNERGLGVEAIRALATHEMKAKEEALLKLQAAWGKPLQTFSAEELKAEACTLQCQSSSFVLDHAGTPAVAAPAASLLIQKKGHLVQDKVKRDGVSLALAVEELELDLNKEEEHA